MFSKTQLLNLLATLFFAGCSGTLQDPGFTSEGTGNAALSPNLTIHSFKQKEYVKGGSVYNFKFTITDGLGFNSSVLEYSKDGGVTWSRMVSATGKSAESFATLSGEVAVFDWAVPQEPDCSAVALTSDSSQYLIRVTASGRPDAAKTTKKTMTLATVDSCQPILAVDQFSVTSKSKGFITFTLSGVVDAFGLSPIKAVCVKVNNPVAPLETDSCWKSLTALRVASSPTPAAIALDYFAGFTVINSLNVYLWVLDLAGNMTTMSSRSGTSTVDTMGTDYIENIERDCSPVSECTLSISETLTANTTTVGSALVTKAGAPSANSVQIVSDPKYFVITAKGTLIYRDGATNSIKKLNLLTDTSASIMIANGGSSVDGNQATARVFRPSRLALDFEENLYILDYDRVRKVTFATDSNFVVSTIVGGGTDATTATLASGTDLLIAPYDRTTAAGASRYWYGTFEVLQSGVIYLSADEPQSILDLAAPTHARIKIFDPSQIQHVSTLEFSGLGIRGDSGFDVKDLFPFGNFGLILNATFNAVTSLTTRFCEAVATCSQHSTATFKADTGESVGVTGHAILPSQWSNGYYLNSRKGELFHLNGYEAHLSKLNTTSLNWGRVLGNGSYPSGFCADGLSATSCAIRLWDSYVGYNDQVYFVDFGRLRFIDIDGKVRTLIQ